jgi:predicted DNA-binding WGR domain protein
MFAQDSMAKLMQFVGSAVPTQPKLGDFIQVALHCLRPEKNEDKVYLVTVHPGTTASTCHVTAHWGARSAKRLSSQMKAINVSKEAATTEVEKAKQEKLRGGYLPAAYAKLLTDEARSHLSASLGLFEAEQPPKSKGKGQPKEKPNASKVKTAKVLETKPATKSKKSVKVDLKPAVKVVSKSDKKQWPADLSIAKKKISKEAVKPVLAKASPIVAKLDEKKPTAKKVAAIPKKQAAKVLTDEVKKLSPKVAISALKKTAAKKVTKDASTAPLKSASKKAVKTATTPTATVKTPSRRR